ncbi:hypothetical protein KZO01_19880 [Kurthia zopfii]|uniref:hypothetical protein n=1 Tax=Kurthia zopfii TaxID=1650 RepID=UPI000D681907|nr:hypothetical protein [Kurthia zopfii]PWI22521.1 hypothetical protein DF281_06800 [Kurthia zopfii]GEK31679.1 hypothetical protein KZO01_19880 [Kurthia zopfii]
MILPSDFLTSLPFLIFAEEVTFLTFVAASAVVARPVNEDSTRAELRIAALAGFNLYFLIKYQMIAKMVFLEK